MKENTANDKSAFENCVSVIQTTHPVTFAEAIYQALDIHVKAAREKEGTQIACGRGCCYCCRQMVTCTSSEFDAITRFIKSCPKQYRKMILANAKKTVKEWSRYFRENEQSLKYSSLKVYQDWQGRSCPFLLGGACAVYSARPIDCRTAVSAKTCGTQGDSGAMRMHFEVEKWANNMILEEEKETKRLYADNASSPLGYQLHFFHRLRTSREITSRVFILKLLNFSFAFFYNL